MKQALIAAVCSALLVAGCGSSDDQELASVPGGEGTTAAATTPAGIPDVTPSPSPSTGSSGTTFSDPDGRYSLNIGRKWKDLSKGSAKGKAWAVGTPQAGVTPTLGMTTQDLPAAARGITPEQYLALNVKDLKKTGYTVIKQGVISGVNTPKLGAVEYSGKASAQVPEAHFLSIFDMNETTVAIATLVTPPKNYEKYRSALLPYMRTLTVTA